jgi:hypothetical protein
MVAASLVPARGREAKPHLYRVVDRPLQARERPNLDDAERQPSNEQLRHPNLLDGLPKGGSLGVVHEGNDVVCRLQNGQIPASTM